MDLKTFGQAIRELAEEKGVAEDKVIETIELAVAAAYKKDYGKKGQIIRARFNPETGELNFSQIKLAVDESMIKSEEEIEAEEAGWTEAEITAHAPAKTPKPKKESEEEREEMAVKAVSATEEPEIRKVRFNPERHIMLEEARTIKPDIAAGDELDFPLEPKSDFGRIASQTAKQVIIQRIREAEREATYAEFKDKEGQIVSGVVQRIEGRNVFIDLGRGVGVLPPEEQIPRERIAIGERLKTLLIFVEKDAKGPGLFLSRSHPGFMKELFRLEVPEIAGETVEIKALAREPGSRSKIAVVSHDAAVDPVGSMVGQRGVRVSTVINEIGGEKIDIIEWSEDAERFIANALSPAKVIDVNLDASRHEASVLVPPEQLSLAIGKGGQNVRLAAKLTGWKIDVRSPSPAPISPGETWEGKAEAAATTAAEEETGAAAESESTGEPSPDETPETAAAKPEPAPIMEAAEAPAPEAQPAEAPAEEKPKKKRATKKKAENATEIS